MPFLVFWRSLDLLASFFVFVTYYILSSNVCFLIAGTTKKTKLPESTLDSRLTCGGPEVKLIISAATAITAAPT